MATCPKCGVEIEYLDYEAEITEPETGTYDANGDYELSTFYLERDRKYSCPMCGEELATDQNEADEILQGVEDEG